MIVLETPRLTNASPPAVRTKSTIVSTSACVASGAITTTISPLPVSIMTKAPGRSRPGAFLTSLASVQHLAGDRPEAGPVTIKEPEVMAHGRKPSARQGPQGDGRRIGPECEVAR